MDGTVCLRIVNKLLKTKSLLTSPSNILFQFTILEPRIGCILDTYSSRLLDNPIYYSAMQTGLCWQYYKALLLKSYPFWPNPLYTRPR